MRFSPRGVPVDKRIIYVSTVFAYLPPLIPNIVSAPFLPSYGIAPHGKISLPLCTRPVQPLSVYRTRARIYALRARARAYCGPPDFDVRLVQHLQCVERLRIFGNELGIAVLQRPTASHKQQLIAKRQRLAHVVRYVYERGVRQALAERTGWTIFRSR